LVRDEALLMRQLFCFKDTHGAEWARGWPLCGGASVRCNATGTIERGEDAEDAAMRDHRCTSAMILAGYKCRFAR